MLGGITLVRQPRPLLLLLLTMLMLKVNPQPVNQSGTEISNLSMADLSQTSPKGIKKKSKEIKKEKEKRNHLGEGPS